MGTGSNASLHYKLQLEARTIPPLIANLVLAKFYDNYAKRSTTSLYVQRTFGRLESYSLNTELIFEQAKHFGGKMEE